MPLTLGGRSRVLMLRRPDPAPRLPSFRVRSSTRGPNPRRSRPKQANGSIPLDTRSRRFLRPHRSPTDRHSRQWPGNGQKTGAATPSICPKIPPSLALRPRSDPLPQQRLQTTRRRKSPIRLVLLAKRGRRARSCDLRGRRAVRHPGCCCRSNTAASKNAGRRGC